MNFEARKQKAERIAQALRNGDKVSRWDLFPVRHLVREMVKNSPALLHEVQFLTDEATN